MPGSAKSQPNRAYVGCGTYIVASEDANDFAVAVEFAEDPLFHVLFGGKLLAKLFAAKANGSPSSILAELEASWRVCWWLMGQREREAQFELVQAGPD